MKSFILLPVLALCVSSTVLSAAAASNVIASSNARSAANADPYLRAYAYYYTASTFDLLAETVDLGLANDAAVLSQSNVIILENIPAEIFNNLSPEYQAYFQSVLPLEQAAAAQIAALAEGDTEGLTRISTTLQAQKAELISKYPNAAPLLNDMEPMTGIVFDELNLDQYQSDYAEKNAEALQNDPKAMSAMLRGMMDIVIKAIYAM